MQAIDLHAHFGDPSALPLKDLEIECTRMSLHQLREEYNQQGIVASCISPLEAFFPGDEKSTLDANLYMQELSLVNDWIYQWVVVNPLIPKTYQQAEQMLKSRKCVGVKIHPFACDFSIEKYGDEIFQFCREQNAVILTHSGDRNCMPESYVPLANQYPEVTLILAHQGWGGDGRVNHQVNAVQHMQSQNVFIDVSSVKSIINYIIEWGVGELSAERFLFGTDTPLHNIAMMKARVEYARIDDSARAAILYRNAVRLFPGVFDELIK